MPFIPFTTEIHTEEYFSIDEILSECNETEIEEVIEFLKKRNYTKIPKVDMLFSIQEESYRENCEILMDSYHRLTTEDENTINNIANKYK